MTSGIAEALAMLKRLESPDLSEVLEEESKRLVGIAQVYPPPPANSKYVRQNTLKDNWSPIPASRTGGGWSAGAENPTEYGDYVMGEDQAPVHQGRWKTTDQIAEAEETRIAAAVEQAMLRIAGE